MAGQIHLDGPDARGIARLTLDHPGKLNALNVAMWRQLQQFVNQLAQDPALRVLLVRGAGGSFVAGGDIEEFPQFRFEAASLAHFHEEVVGPALQALWDLDAPVVAQIDGACIGGGLEIAACCDLRIAGRHARFGVPIAKLGFPMAPLEVEIVSRVVGETLLREFLLEARVIEAPEALSRGLISRMVSDDQVAAEAEAAAQRMAALSPLALRLNKRGLRQFAAGHPSTRAEREPHYAYAPSAQHKEGLAAFNEKRPARFE